MKQTILIDVEFLQLAASDLVMTNLNHRYEVKRQALKALKDAGYELEESNSYNQLAAGTSAV